MPNVNVTYAEMQSAARQLQAGEQTIEGAPDAARIARATPGRGYVRLGHASLVPFQAARIGGRRPGADPMTATGRPLLVPVDWAALGRPEPRRPAAGHADDEALSDEAGDLKVLVGQIRHAADALRIPAQHSPWLAPLPQTLLLRDLPAPGRKPDWGQTPLPFGLRGDELTALGPDLSDGAPAFIVAGPARSGRSAVLASMTRSFLAGGAQVILVTPRPSPLRSLASLGGVARSFEQSDLGEEELAAAIASLTAPGAVVIDDADLLTDCEAGGELSKIITRGSGWSLALVVAGDPDTLAGGFGGWQADARRDRRGCLTAPRSDDECATG